MLPLADKHRNNSNNNNSKERIQQLSITTKVRTNDSKSECNAKLKGKCENRVLMFIMSGAANPGTKKPSEARSLKVEGCRQCSPKRGKEVGSCAANCVVGCGIKSNWQLAGTLAFIKSMQLTTIKNLLDQLIEIFAPFNLANAQSENVMAAKRPKTMTVK